MRILVTGGAGYIGSVLVSRLLRRKWHVTVLDNFYFNQPTLLEHCISADFSIVRGDCRDERVMRKLVSEHDAIIPLAALVGAPLCQIDEIAAKTTNLEAIRLICKHASPSQRILFPVTNSGYGIADKSKPCTEESPLRPISLYGVTKVEAEKLVLERENSITFRLATVFGASPRMRIDLLVNDFVYRAVYDRAVLVFEGHFKRNYIHIQDVAKAFEYALDHFENMSGEPYNVGLESANLSKLELCAEIKKVLPSFVYLEAPIGEDPDKRDYIVSNARLLSTGFKPEFSLQDGIHELTKAYTILRNSVYSNV